MSTIYHAAIPVDLAAPSRQRIGAAQFFMGDNDSHVFTALVADTDAPEAGLRAGTVSGTALRADGVTVALEGTKGADVQEVTFPNGITAQATPCSVTLPQAAFAVPGSLLISIKLVDGTTATTVLALSGTVIRTETDAAVDPGEIIPDLATLQAAAAQAMEAAEAATEAADHAVQYDAAQSLTDAQQAQARENIGASNADVTDLLAEPVEYWDADRTVTLSGRSLTRTGGYTYTLNGTASGNLYYRLSDVLAVISTSSGMNNWTSSIQFEENVPYTLTVVPVSGRLVRGDSFYFRVTAEDGTLVRSLSVTDAAESATFYWPDSTKKGKLVLRVSTDTVTENFVFRVYLTRRIYPDRNIAVTETSVSRIGYGVGSLLTMGGTLYKTTQAIVAGDTITPGINVTATTVAEQLAALEARIAALEG